MNGGIIGVSNRSPRAAVNSRGLIQRSMRPMDSLSIPRTSGIYRITCIPTGKIYIGSSCHPFRRWIEHRRSLRAHCHCNLHLQRAWDKYGEDAFTFEVMEFVMPWSLVEREQYWIDKLKPFSPRGFNIGVKANSGSAGRKASPETRAKLSATHKGKPKSTEHRANISKSKRGTHYHFDNDKRFQPRGHTQTAEGVARRAALLSKRYIVVSPEGIEFEIKNLSQFCRENDLDMPSMLRLCVGGAKQHKGWKCRRIDG